MINFATSPSPLGLSKHAQGPDDLREKFATFPARQHAGSLLSIDVDAR